MFRNLLSRQIQNCALILLLALTSYTQYHVYQSDDLDVYVLEVERVNNTIIFSGSLVTKTKTTIHLITASCKLRTYMVFAEYDVKTEEWVALRNPKRKFAYNNFMQIVLDAWCI